MDPEILFDHEVDRSRLSDLDREIIAGAARQANVPHVYVTRTASTPEQQARAMFSNCVGEGAASQFRLYGPFGDEVVQVFVDSREAQKSDADTVAAMTAKILELGPQNVSHHCVEDWDELHVIDLSAQRIPRGERDAFEEAIAGDERITVHFSPFTDHRDPAFHLEIPQTA